MLIRIYQVKITVKHHMIPLDDISLVLTAIKPQVFLKTHYSIPEITHIPLPSMTISLIRRFWPLKIRLLPSWLMLILTIYQYSSLMKNNLFYCPPLLQGMRTLSE